MSSSCMHPQRFGLSCSDTDTQTNRRDRITLLTDRGNKAWLIDCRRQQQQQQTEQKTSGDSSDTIELFSSSVESSSNAFTDVVHPTPHSASTNNDPYANIGTDNYCCENLGATGDILVTYAELGPVQSGE